MGEIFWNPVKIDQFWSSLQPFQDEHIVFEQLAEGEESLTMLQIYQIQLFP